MKRRMFSASSADFPRIRSTTKRAFWGEVRRYLPLAVASDAMISSSPYAFGAGAAAGAAAPAAGAPGAPGTPAGAAAFSITFTE